MRSLPCLLLAACVHPAMRPARTTPGSSITAGAAYLAGAEDEVFCYETCEERQVANVSPLSAETDYGVMLSEHLGVTGGVALAGPATTKHPGALGLFALFSQLSLQNDRGAIAVGLDVGANMIGPGLVADLIVGHGLTLSVGARHHDAIREPDGPIDRYEVDSSEVSGALRWRMFLVQHTYYTRESGRLELPMIVEGATQAKGWHVVLVGLHVDSTTAPGLNL